MKVCVIGGGAAGMMAAIAASKEDNSVYLFEQNEKLGKKLFLTGKGRCNLANACDTEELFDNIVNNPKFLYSAIYSFTNADVIDFFEKNGLKVKEERGKRVFPVSDHSSDVIGTLTRVCKRQNVNILLNTKVKDIVIDDDRVTGVILENGKVYDADAVILATGGASYKTTGSDGKFLEILGDKGIKINDLSPSLVPFSVNDSYITNMQGLSLKNVTLTMKVNNKERYSGFGEMLFTHFGVSGPLVLAASTKLNKDDYEKNIKLSIDLKPALTNEMLDKRILKDFSENQNKYLENVLGKLLPSLLIPSVIKISNIDGKKRVNLITKEERTSLVNLLKNFPINVSGNRGFNEAIITRGGVDVKEINPSTMELKKIKGLFVAGEMIDTDAYTGGFNLQIAWSTGHLAGESING